MVPAKVPPGLWNARYLALAFVVWVSVCPRHESVMAQDTADDPNTNNSASGTLASMNPSANQRPTTANIGNASIKMMIPTRMTTPTMKMNPTLTMKISKQKAKKCKKSRILVHWADTITVTLTAKNPNSNFTMDASKSPFFQWKNKCMMNFTVCDKKAKPCYCMVEDTIYTGVLRVKAHRLMNNTQIESVWMPKPGKRLTANVPVGVILGEQRRTHFIKSRH
ncbi:hypothetical protein ElyMa_003478200 [Elysia marginata]|uniref:Phlebovirus glycoprotein G2 fusion domain-containing protein n=1 Tax=Elysia marginata TaxID=1093978 RepID=A0AAV4EBX2_9GAST|nr:hypothetical protein ElyMa_003478200 [Elysia marginata]